MTNGILTIFCLTHLSKWLTTYLIFEDWHNFMESANEPELLSLNIQFSVLSLWFVVSLHFCLLLPFSSTNVAKSLARYPYTPPQHTPPPQFVWISYINNVFFTKETINEPLIRLQPESKLDFIKDISGNLGSIFNISWIVITKLHRWINCNLSFKTVNVKLNTWSD